MLNPPGHGVHVVLSVIDSRCFLSLEAELT